MTRPAPSTSPIITGAAADSVSIATKLDEARAGFTPGPWQAEPMVPLADNAFYITATPDGNNSAKDIATVGPCLAKTTAPNARLIAAAPALYEACEDLAERMLAAFPSLADTPEVKRAIAALNQVRAA